MPKFLIFLSNNIRGGEEGHGKNLCHASKVEAHDNVFIFFLEQLQFRHGSSVFSNLFDSPSTSRLFFQGIFYYY
jgi:hypothetical protein